MEHFHHDGYFGGRYITHKQFVQVIFEEFKDLVNTEILGEYESIH